jgi:nicotinamidase-related amidase
MQEFFFQKSERRHNLYQTVENINHLIKYFDARTLPVIHVVSRYKADRSDWDLKMRASGTPELIEGAQEAAILSEIKVADNHRIITKTRYSAFFKTNLAELLHAENIDRVVVVGAYTHYCVNATIYDAYGHDFVPCIITDAIISHLQDEAAVIIDRMRRNGYHVLPTQELITDLEHR